MVTRAQQIRARLWRPPNAVPDNGIALCGKYAKRARWELIVRQAAERVRWEAEEAQRAKERGYK